MELNDLDDLYRDPVLDHCRHPRNQDPIEDPDLAAEAVNPFCGDEVALQVALDGDRVSRVGVQSQGCSINQASASMLSEAITGKSIGEVLDLSASFEGMMRSPDTPDEEVQRLGELRALAGVREFPVRIKCALLAWSALEDATEGYRRRREAD